MSNPVDNAFEALDIAMKLIIQDRNKLLKENKELKDKAEKYDKTLDQLEWWQRETGEVMNLEQIWQKNLKLEQQNKELEREIVYQKSCVDEVLERNQKNKQIVEKIRKYYKNLGVDDEICHEKYFELEKILGREE